MIKNVVFDFGQVLVHFEPAYIVSQYVTDAEDAALLERVLFSRRYWDRLDEGTLDNDEMLAQCNALLPARLHDTARDIIYGWIHNLPEMEGMRALVKELKEVYGVKLFLLSNISVYFAAHASEFSILSLFDDCVFSGVCKKVKPHAEIFAHLCEQCNITPEETVFVDDNTANIAAAREYGITGYLFDGDAERLRAYLSDLLK